ncbi:hypothetical protein [Paenibacillus sp. V4I5]|uniref:hypothetical protein n=1 Tax=Paenibacillus sp. V4I5 TaxID=3042306 RepID=UPI0027902AFF|nr:hypothetical protein [Paenibacillus sp. V4I5]MDQ0920540.1 hypothetical protein [Paenibacillus sp. V4I5]
MFDGVLAEHAAAATLTFKSYSIQAGTLTELKSKIKVKKTGASAYTALGLEDTVASNTPSTSRSSTFEINFKDALVGSGNSIQIASGAFKAWYGKPMILRFRSLYYYYLKHQQIGKFQIQ